MSCRSTMENLAHEIYLEKQQEKRDKENEDLINFWLGTFGGKPIRKPVLDQSIVKNTVEPWVGKEMAKKFDEMNRITIKTNEDFKGAN